MPHDERALRELVEMSEDLHVDGMRAARCALDEMVEAARTSPTRQRADLDRRSFLRRSVFAAGALGAGLGAAQLARATVLVAADSSRDIQMLQTAASLENLAVAVYTKAAGLPAAVSGASNPVVLKFVQTTVAQHADHANAFNAAASKLGGKAQTDIDRTVHDAVVTPALAKIRGPMDVLSLARTLEDAAAQTYVRFGSSADDGAAVGAFASIAPVEAQHVAVLSAVAALAGARGLDAVTLPPDLAALPAVAGSAGFPRSFYAFDAARPAAEGAVK